MDLSSILSTMNNVAIQKPNALKIAEYEKTAIANNNYGPANTTLTDIQTAMESTDEYIQSPEIANAMNQITGTGGDDAIRAWSNEDGSITVSVNGQETVYDSQEAMNGFRVSSGDGNDSIDFSSIGATLIINAGEGDNDINLGYGRNIVKAGDGNNSVTAVGSYRTNISLGNGDNVISAGADGNEYNTINAGNGNNTIEIGNASGTIHTGNGNDSITTGNGNTKIYTGNGENTVKAGNGNNYIQGGAGTDTITAGNGNNVIYGLDGNDKITAGNGKNYIDGGKGDDEIKAGSGKNIISGGKGDDKIETSGSGKIIDDGNGKNIKAEGADISLYDSDAKSSLGSSIKIEGDDAFKMRIESDIETYKGTESGTKLLSELDKAKKKTSIKETGDANGYASATSKHYEDKYVSEKGKRGKGSDAEILLNPSFSLVQGKNTAPPSTVLFHEGVHAYNDVTGTMQPGMLKRKDGTLVKAAEHQAVGLPIPGGIETKHPDGTKTSANPELLTENAFRKDLGIDQRTRY